MNFLLTLANALYRVLIFVYYALFSRSIFRLTVAFYHIRSLIIKNKKYGR